MRRTVVVVFLLATILVAFPSRTVRSSECVISPSEEQLVEAAYARLKDANVMRGGPAKLDPSTLYGTLTRAEYSVVLVHALGWDLSTQMNDHAVPFSDTEGHWASPGISLLFHAGIVAGYGDGTFHPDEKMSLTHAKIVLARLLRTAPLVTTDNVDTSLYKAGIKVAELPCSSGQYLLRSQQILLLDKALSTPMYSRNR